jgi:AAA domain-containing protein
MSIQLIPFNEVQLSRDPSYLVQGLLPRTGISVLWGPPKSGKTFWLFDLMTHVASNREYRSRKVNGGSVVYCCFEGIEGYGGRIEAIKQHGPQSGRVPSLYLMPTRLELAADYQKIIDAVKERLKPDLSDLQRLAAKKQQLQPNLDWGQAINDATTQRRRECNPAAIVLDTLNRSFAGSESNDADMTAYIRAADALKNEFQCAVIIVHHSGHDAARPRGHSSLTAAVDAQLSAKRNADDQIIVEVEWMRDGPEGDRVFSRLKQVPVGTDKAGDPIRSCIVVPDDVPASGTVSSGKLKLALETFDAAADPDA